jgi:uncharacterized protein YcbX
MQGEELNATEIGARGLLGDRAYALIDSSTGKVAGAKNPRKWPNLFDFRAVYIEPPAAADVVSRVRITLPNGYAVTSDDGGIDERLSQDLGRAVTLQSAGPKALVLEEYWPDLEGLPHRDAVTDEALPTDSFVDLAPIHLLTTATLNRLRELYAPGRFEVRRFRPNIVVALADGASGFFENDWVGHALTLGPGVRLHISKPCGRCVMTTLAQADLPRDIGILRTAVQHNHGQVGVYAKVIQGGTVRRGDSVGID